MDYEQIKNLQNGVHAPVKALRNRAVLPPGPLF